MSFADLKRNRRSQIDKLVNEAEKVKGGKKNYGDDRFWKPTVDKAGNGYAVIRFLPAKNVEELPWTQYWDHGFQGPTGRWYIERSLTSINQPDPVSELNSYLWNSGHEEDKETARKQKRRLHYVSNIYVVSDPANPENEGKVFLYQYGKKIFNKITDVMEPEFEDETPINPFDLWEGADFKLKIRQVEGYRNYDKSEFASPSALKDDDKELEKIFESVYDLAEFTDPKEYKTYAVLSRKLHDILGSDLPAQLREDVKDQVVDAPAPASEPEAQDEIPAFGGDDVEEMDEEDMKGFFEKLAAED
jgi:hypothetical protein